ncbi:MAG: hypothetical protein ACOH13_06400 [Flavobacteriales bacterium]
MGKVLYADKPKHLACTSSSPGAVDADADQQYHTNDIPRDSANVRYVPDHASAI